MRFPQMSASLLVLALGASVVAQGNLEMGKMWTFENPPLAYLEKEYGFKPDQKWLDSLRLASLRWEGGCSASFVSPKGLIMTNHHCVRRKIGSVQGAEDWIKDGFYATSLEDEIRLPRQSVQQLISSKDVTDQVNEGITDADDDATVAKKRGSNQQKILKSAREEHKGLSPQIITMHQGAAFQLYVYKIYSDIRLVCAPHLQTSHFGGDPDNFTYPRFGIDFTFCRAYDSDGKPADTAKHYFRWSKAGPKKGELAFVTGNPGSTGRLLTKGQMSFLREARYPMRIEQITDQLEIVRARAAQDPRYEKRVRTQLLGMENSQKALTGYLAGLHNPSIQKAKEAAEAEFLGKVNADAETAKKYGKAWAVLEEVNERKIALQPLLNYYTATRNSSVLGRAAALVRATDPDISAQARRRAEDQVRASVRENQTAEKLLASHFKRAAKWLGKDDPYVKYLIGDKSPEEAVQALKKSILVDREVADELLEGGRKAIENSDDHVVRAALHFVPARRKAAAEMARLNTREGVQATLIGQALFAVYGNSASPDATFSLRFSDGRVEGYPYNGTIAPYRTTFFGLFGRNAEFDNKYPFNLPQVWLDRKDKIDMTKGVNFVATNDIIGGNSGSPMVNKDLEVIGLIFDGNIEMLGNRFVYKDDVPRSVSVHSQAIMEAIAKIYDADRLVAEIMDAAK